MKLNFTYKSQMHKPVNDTSNSRLEWVDTLKFLGIFAIYLGHIPTGIGKFHDFVFIYHVPLFFFVAGFFANYKTNQTISEFIKSRFQRLIVPYLIFTTITLVIRSGNEGFQTGQFLDGLLGIAYGVRNDQYVGTLWFFPCLFIISIMDFLSIKIIKNNVLVFLLSFSLYFYTQLFMSFNPMYSPRWFMNLDSALSYWWLLPFGRLVFPVIKNEFVFKNNILSNALAIFLLCASAFTLMNMMSFYHRLALLAPSVQTSRIFNSVDNILITSTIILANVFIAKRLSKVKMLSDIGKNTQNICGMELITKTLIAAIISIFSLQLIISSPLAAFFYVMLCVYSSDKITRSVNKKFPSLISIK